MPVKIECQVRDGFIASEKIVRILGSDGQYEEVTVSAKNLSGNKLEASEIGRNRDEVLVELPRETTSGRWRVWVNQSSIGG